MKKKPIHTFHVGQSVMLDDFGRRKGPFLVLEVIPVPEDLIAYDPETQSGGVGHHQWCILDGHTRGGQVSGLLLEPA